MISKLTTAIVAMVTLTVINQFTVLYFVRIVDEHNLTGLISILSSWGIILAFTTLAFYTIPHKNLGIRNDKFYWISFLGVVGYCGTSVAVILLEIVHIKMIERLFIATNAVIAFMPFFCFELFKDKYFPKPERRTKVTKLNP